VSTTRTFPSHLLTPSIYSLSATFLRLRITGALRSSKELAKAAEAVTQNVVYTYPTLDSLTEFIVEVVADPTGSRPKKAQGGSEAIEEMIKKYTVGLNVALPAQRSEAHERVVLLTGSTGNIGAQILTDLLEDKGVHQIYALNRSSSGSQTILDRHRARFEDKGLDTSLLKSEKLIFINGDTSEERLGLDEATYNEVSVCSNNYKPLLT
jgi:FlaA1/EpsC-like NDP-sugar epimerase